MYSWKERSVVGSCRWLLRNLLRAIFVLTGLSTRPDAAKATALDYFKNMIKSFVIDKSTDRLAPAPHQVSQAPSVRGNAPAA